MTTDPGAGAQDIQQQIDDKLAQAEQAVSDLTNRVTGDLQGLRDQVAKLQAQGTVDVTEIINRIDHIVVNVQSVDASQIVGTGAPAAEGISGEQGQQEQPPGA